MTSPLVSADPAVLLQLWKAAYPDKFGIGADTLKNSVLECTLTVMSGSFWINQDSNAEAMVSLKRSGTPTWFIGNDPETGHVSVWAERTMGTIRRELLPLVVEAARAQGMKRLAFGMDADHVFPGCPTDMPGLRAELEACGFKETGACCDLERDLVDYDPPDACDVALRDARASVRTCTEDDAAELDQFFVREFPGRWRHDVMRKMVADDEPDDIHILIVDGKIEGFAMTQIEGSRRPVCGATWRLSLGPHWGALGPIGVSKAVRGKGLGNAVLGYALEGLRQLGARRTIIDWTNLVDFYGAHGFEVARRYTCMVKDLD